MFSFLFNLCLSQSGGCSIKTFRDARGTGIQCDCPGVHTTNVSVQLTVDVEASCVSNCTRSDSAVIVGCLSKDSTKFTEAVVASRQNCCGACGGSLTGNLCQRNFLPSRPIPFTPTSGCVTKVRELEKGLSYQCKCASGLDASFDTFTASGVDDDCIRSCSGQPLQRTCNEASQSGNFASGAAWVSKYCCESCRGVSLDGAYTCGFDTTS